MGGYGGSGRMCRIWCEDVGGCVGYGVRMWEEWASGEEDVVGSGKTIDLGAILFRVLGGKLTHKLACFELRKEPN